MRDKKRLKEINKLSLYFGKMGDLELQSYVKHLRKDIAEGNPEEDILIRGFALVREADRRILNLYPTDDQVLGALALYDGKIAEIKTGEGKSLVATMPLFLKSLVFGSVFLVTTNDYLASRDYDRIGPVYRWLGLTVSKGGHNLEDRGEEYEKRREVYSADIIYISNSTLGFDFLIDGLVDKKEKQCIPPLNYVLLDEVDEILLDRAQMPLLISGAPKVQSNYFVIADQFVQTLINGVDFKLDESNKSVWLTERGIKSAKSYLAQERLLEKGFFAIYQHIILALKAHHVLKKARDYLIENGELKLLDAKDGRVLEGTKLRSGLHQAIEVKEGLEMTPETKTISSITYQNFFRQFRQLSGMSGTAKVAESEFINTYNVPVKVIGTHRRDVRKDYAPQQYVSFDAKMQAALSKVKELHSLGRPVLVITGSISAADFFSIRLLDLGIPHNTLNAKSSVKESQIIQEAGRVGSVTVSTTMAGRGTDIQLDASAIKKGGLAVVLTERMFNKRTELQAKGRAGRQGEPGETFAFESLEDEIIRTFVQESVQRYYDKHRGSQNPIRNRRVRKVFERAQEMADDQASYSRTQALLFDEVVKLQKQSFNKSREMIIRLSSIQEAYQIIDNQALFAFREHFHSEENYSEKKIQRFILDNVDYNFKRSWLSGSLKNSEERIKFVQSLLRQNLERKRVQLHDDPAFLQYLKVTLLKSIDLSWSSQVDVLDQLGSIVSMRSTAQKSPFREFEREARQSYEVQRKELAQLILRNVALTLFEIKEKELIVTFP